MVEKTSKCKDKGHLSKARIVCQNKKDLLAEEQAKKAGECSKGESVTSQVGDSSKGVTLKEAIYSAFESPRFVRLIGPKHVQIFRHFLPSMLMYTLAGTLCTVYLCEWKDVLQHVPFWRDKYNQEE